MTSYRKRLFFVCSVFLLLSGLFLCGTAAAAETYTDNVYAVLYQDGTMVFQHGNTPESGRAVREIYPVAMDKRYN